MTLRRFLFILFACLACGPPAFAQDSSSGPFTITANSQCVQTSVTGRATVVMYVSGTFSMTIQPEVAILGQAAANKQVTPSTSTTAQSTITAVGNYRADVAGQDLFQLCSTAYTSGTATIYFKVTGNISTDLLGGGGGGGGTVTSVSGTANQIDVATGTTTPVVSLDPVIVFPGSIRTGAFLADFSAGTMEIPEAAGFTTNVDSTIGADTNTLITHLWGPGSIDTLNVVTTATSTTTTQPLFATAVAGIYNPRAIAAGDLPSSGIANVVYNNAANTFTTAGTLDIHGSTVANAVRLQSLAACTSNGTDSVCYDPTAKLFHVPTNSADSTAVVETSTTTTTTQALFASAVAGIYGPRAIATGDLPTAIPIGNVGSSGLSGTSPITISAAGAIGCATCNTTSSNVISVFTRTGAVTATSGDYSLDKIAALAATTTVANGNNSWILNCALTSATTCITRGETTAATTAGAVEDQITTLTTSTAIPLQITQGANGPAGAAAPAVINISAAAAGGIAGASSAGNTGAPITFLTGAGSAGGATSGSGGAGGGFNVTLGGGGAAGGNSLNAGGTGGAATITPGVGNAGAATGGGGAAGNTIISAATGGAGGATSGTGGHGSDFLVTTGTGGAATAGSITGRGGNATFSLGSAGGTGTAGAPGVFSIQGGTVGGARTDPILNATETWNTTGVDNGAFITNITCTAAAANSKEFDFQVAAVSQLNLSFAGANCATPVLTSLGNIVSGAAAGAPNVDKTIGFLASAMGQQTTATCTNVTNMAWNVAASKNYVLHCQLPVTFAASATIAFCLGGPGTPTSYNINAVGSIGAAGVYDDINLIGATVYSGTNKTTASGAVGASTQVVLVDAAIQNGSTASGTALTLQTAANGTNGFTILADAACTLTGVN